MEIARKEHREDYSDLPQDALTLIRSYVIEKIAGHKYLFLIRVHGGYKHIVHDPKEIDKIENILRHLSNQGLL